MAWDRLCKSSGTQGVRSRRLHEPCSAAGMQNCMLGVRRCPACECACPWERRSPGTKLCAVHRTDTGTDNVGAQCRAVHVAACRRSICRECGCECGCMTRARHRAFAFQAGVVASAGAHLLPPPCPGLSFAVPPAARPPPTAAASRRETSLAWRISLPSGARCPTAQPAASMAAAGAGMEGGGGGRGEQLRAEGGAGQARDGVAGPGDAAGSSDGGDGGDSGSARGWIGDVQVLSGATAIEHLLRTAEPVVQGSSAQVWPWVRARAPGWCKDGVFMTKVAIANREAEHADALRAARLRVRNAETAYASCALRPQLHQSQVRVGVGGRRREGGSERVGPGGGQRNIVGEGIESCCGCRCGCKLNRLNSTRKSKLKYAERAGQVEVGAARAQQKPASSCRPTGARTSQKWAP